MNKVFSEKSEWDEMWQEKSLPVIAEFSKKKFLRNKILQLISEHADPAENSTVLEIGGAPGQYAAWFARELKCKVSIIDYSEIGVEKARKNFELLNIDAEVYLGDIFDSNIKLPQFDIVFSLGFIEHFGDLTDTVANHLKCLKPGGILILGTPNFRGINRLILSLLAPVRLSHHNLAVMNADGWNEFEESFALKRSFRAYTGGFDPAAVNLKERKNPLALLLRLFLFGLQFANIFLIRGPLKKLRDINSKYFSSYLMGVYRKPQDRGRG